jgi:hypothetical protein
VPHRGAKRTWNSGLTDLKKGEEDIEMPGKKLKRSWVNITITQPERTIEAKAWHTADIPGGLVQSETGSMHMTNTMKLSEFEVAK